LNCCCGGGQRQRAARVKLATYLFKHALIQDAAYGTLLRGPRRALHARIADTLESQFTDIAESQPELVARHCTEAGLIEKALGLWGKAGQRSLARSALVEATEQFTRALNLIETLPISPSLRREQIRLQVALITPLLHIKGYAAPEAKAAAERAALLIEQAKVLGDPPEDPLLLFSVLYGIWVANYVAFHGDVLRELAAQFLALAEKEGTTAPLMIGHRLMGMSLLFTGEIQRGRAHYDKAIALYNPLEHRALAERFGQDVRVAILSYRPLALWLLGYPNASFADIEQSLREAREIGQAATLMYALGAAAVTFLQLGDYARAGGVLDELIPLAEQKGAVIWKAFGVTNKGCALAATGETQTAVDIITTGLALWRSTGGTLWTPLFQANLAKANAGLGNFQNAFHCIDEATAAIETSNDSWYEAEVQRVAGEIMLKSPDANAEKAQTYFERALAVARQQQAKSWELRASKSLARLWRDQGKVQQARELLAPVYGWFTEGFDTLDLREAKALLDTLAQ
jgi:predicted ATPase